MMSRRFFALGLAAAIAAHAGSAVGYPGGTPDFQTDIAPFCAACHSSTTAQDLEGAGERADKEVAGKKHYPAILAGDKVYGKLSEADRATLVQQLEALDANSKIEIEFPPQVAPGETFRVTVKVTGGAGPVVGVALVDRAHRWFARPASSVGWEVVGAPTVIGPDGQPQTQWLDRRPERVGRGVTYVNITGIESDATKATWSKGKVIFTMKAPNEPGDYPLVGAYLYGTEKATTLGSTSHPVYGKQPLGGYGGKSGRVRFSASHVITVKQP